MSVLPVPFAAEDAPEKVRVLVVEDHEATLYAHCNLLLNRGYSVVQAATASIALTTSASFQPHCVLLDLGLPDMLGTDVARQLRQRHGPELVIIAVTGIDDSELHELAEVSGVDLVIKKPLDVEKIASILPVVGVEATGQSSDKLR